MEFHFKWVEQPQRSTSITFAYSLKHSTSALPICRLGPNRWGIWWAKCQGWWNKCQGWMKYNLYNCSIPPCQQPLHLSVSCVLAMTYLCTIFIKLTDTVVGAPAVAYYDVELYSKS